MKPEDMSDEELLAIIGRPPEPAQQQIAKQVKDMTDEDLLGVINTPQPVPIDSAKPKEGAAEVFNRHLSNLNGTAHQGMEHALSSDKVASNLEYMNARDSGELAQRNEALNMPNFVAHDAVALTPLLGPALASTMMQFEGSPAAEKLIAATKDVPYVGATVNSLIGQGPSKFDLKAGQEASKMIAGAGELKDFVRTLLPGDNTDVYKSVMDRQREQSSNDEAMKYVNKNPGVGGVVGASLPYVLSQYALGGPVGKGVESAVSKVTSIPGEAAVASKGVLTKLIDKWASNPGIGGRLAAPLQKEFTIPWAERALTKSRQVATVDPYTAGRAGRTMGGAALGAVEGGVHYDNSMGQGAVSGGLGAATGEVLRPMLIRTPNYYNKQGKDLIEWYKKEGANPLPGLESGSKRLQKFEAGMRNDSMLGDKISQYDAANDIVNNQIVGRAIGVPANKYEYLGPAELTDHLASLSNKYKSLEDSTFSRLTPADKSSLALHVKSLENDIDPDVQKTAKTVASYVQHITDAEKAGIMQRDPLTGRMLPRAMEGGTISDIRSRLKSDIADAYKSDNTVKAKALEPVLAKVDKSIEQGIVSRGGTPEEGAKILQDWKDTNEQWALTNLVIDKGLTPTGSVAPGQLLNHFRSNDAKRFFTESGGDNITQLHKLAKVGYLDRTQAGSDLTGLGAKEFFNQSNPNVIMKLLQTPVAGYVPVLPSAALNMYTKGIPSLTGLTNMSGHGFGNPGMYIRASEQATQPWPSLYQGVLDKANGVVEEFDNIKHGVKKSYENWYKD